MGVDPDNLLSTLEPARAKIEAICAALPGVDWESDAQMCAWLDARHEASRRHKIVPKQHPDAQLDRRSQGR